MNSFKNFLILIAALLSICSHQFTLAQTVNNVGENHSIASKFLDEDRIIQISTPENYDPKSKSYPVLYLLDGQRFFLYGVSLQQSFSQFRLTPEFIVVGISNQYPQRFRHFTETEKFMSYLTKEVVPYVDEHYSTKGENLIFGWEYAGAFSLEMMTIHNDVFQAFFLASPFPITENRLNKIDSLYQSATKTASLYFTVSEYENEVNKGIDQLRKVLKNKDDSDWTFELLPNESHRSTPYHTIYYGLSKYYHNYSELQFSTLAEFQEKGGLSYVYDYYQQRSARFGFPNQLTSWTKFSLIRNAIRADDLTEFLQLMQEFKNDEFWDTLLISCYLCGRNCNWLW